jgi:hypothetical protein
VLTASRNLGKEKKGGGGVSISEDYSRESREVCKGLLEHMEHIRKKHVDV